MVVAAVHPDVLPLHKAKVGEEVELRGLAGLGVLARPGTPVLGNADRAVKIKDGRRLKEGRRLIVGGWQVEVKKLRVFPPQESGAPRDRLRQDDIVLMVVIIGPPRERQQEAGAEDATGCTGRGAQKAASGQSAILQESAPGWNGCAGHVCPP